MFKKILLSLAMIGIAFLTGYATAQSYFINKAPAPIAMASNDQPSNSVLSPSDFQSQTQQLQEKKKQAMSDQLKQELAKIPPTTPPPPPAPEPGASGTPGQAATPGTTQPADANPAPSQPAAEEAAPSGPTPAAPPATAPAQADVYTGFQNQDKNQKDQNQSPPAGTNQSQPSSSGGWNIKY